MEEYFKILNDELKIIEDRIKNKLEQNMKLEDYELEYIMKLKKAHDKYIKERVKG